MVTQSSWKHVFSDVVILENFQSESLSMVMSIRNAIVAVLRS